MPNQNHDRKLFIADYSVTSQIVNREENMVNLKYTETQVTIVDSRTPTGTKHGDWHRYQRRDEKS